MSNQIFYEPTQELRERRLLVQERILEISQETMLSENQQTYFREISDFILLVHPILEEKLGITSASKKYDVADYQKLQNQLYGRLAPKLYDRSFLNPAYAVDALGEELGGLLSALYADILAIIPYAYEGREDLVTIFMELFVQVYGCFMEEDGDLKEIKKNVNEAIYWFYHDYSEIFAAEPVIGMVDVRADFFRNIVMKSDFNDITYLYQYGSYIGENELQLAAFLNTLSPDEIQKMADTYTEGYRMGFEATGKDITKKKTVKVEYPIGFERVVRQAICNFEAMHLEATITREAVLSFTGRGSSKRGCYSSSMNKQFDYDHKDDRAYYFDKAFVERRLEVLKDTFEKNKELAAEHGGPAVIEVFGETPFHPENKPQRKTYSDRQNELNVYFASQAGQMTNSYIKGEERSFTIIAFPIPAIGEKFPEIFAKTMELNTLDYKLYQNMQQKIIQVLDQGIYARITGRGKNHTNLTVALYPLRNPEKETIFENCVADVNIPVGEVFTSPVLEGTNGTLHVTGVFLNELYYQDLEVTFTEGKISSYTCSNFPTEEENQKYIYDNVLHHHKTLPMGEFAIGTNTTAYRMAQDYQIADKLPILIAEKTGPHFAVGDTCYSYEEDTPMYNPDGKEVVAMDNSCSILRKEDMAKAYFNCHTDITIPYDELDRIWVVDAKGQEHDVIRQGRFVVPGTEVLNVPLDV